MAELFDDRFVLDNGQFLVNVHKPGTCAGTFCVIHNPSKHHMRDWKLHFRNDRGLMERLCPDHSVGHPDPDALVFQISIGNDWQAVHGCCGCCKTPEEEK